MRLNAVEAIGGVSGPIHIGDLTINANAGTTIDVSAGEALDASLALVTIAPRSLISVPEPGFLITLGCGLVVLFIIRPRSRR